MEMVQSVVRRSLVVLAALSSFACAAVQESGARMTHSMQADSADGLHYHVHAPLAAQGRPSLLVMLHGCTQDAASFTAASRVLEYAAGMVVLFPEQSPAAHVQRCWNWYDPASQGRDSGEAGMIAALTRRVAQQHSVDPARIYVAGISAGGLMASILAAAYPDVYAALGVHSGAAFPAAANVMEGLATMRGDTPAASSAAAAIAAMGSRLRSVPVVIVHGDEDAVVKPVNALYAAQTWWEVHARATGRAAEPVVDRRRGSSGGRAYEVATYADTPGGSAVAEVWMVEGLGHAWSGGAEGGSYADPQGPDAARVIVEFLIRQRRP
jgi:poly(hydroxyalkanoate) depolymerase family esterase